MFSKVKLSLAVCVPKNIFGVQIINTFIQFLIKYSDVHKNSRCVVGSIFLTLRITSSLSRVRDTVLCLISFMVQSVCPCVYKCLRDFDYLTLSTYSTRTCAQLKIRQGYRDVPRENRKINKPNRVLRLGRLQRSG